MRYLAAFLVLLFSSTVEAQCYGPRCINVAPRPICYGGQCFMPSQVTVQRGPLGIFMRRAWTYDVRQQQRPQAQPMPQQPPITIRQYGEPQYFGVQPYNDYRIQQFGQGGRQVPVPRFEQLPSSGSLIPQPLPSVPQ